LIFLNKTAMRAALRKNSSARALLAVEEQHKPLSTAEQAALDTLRVDPGERTVS
jgi:hypothetical protein